MTVITISREAGSWGDEIARRTSSLLQYTLIDKVTMIEAATKTGISESGFIDLDVDSYQFRNLTDRLLGRKEPEMKVAIPTVTSASGMDFRIQTLDAKQCMATLQTVITFLSKSGNIVIVGRGGQAILKDAKDSLHVKIIAPFEVRVRRVMDSQGCNENKAFWFIRDRDKAITQYLKRFFGIEWNDDTLYHLVINTGKLDIEQSSDVIVSSVREFIPIFKSTDKVPL
jgi:cytidylate kinase